MMMTQAVRCLSLGQGAPPSNITTEALHPTARFYGLCLMPSLLSTEEMIDMFLVDHQGFYQIRDTFTVNFLAHLTGQGRNRYHRQLIFQKHISYCKPFLIN